MISKTDFALKVEPTSTTTGAVVSGIDLASPQPQEVIDEIDRLVADHGVLFFLDQELTPDTHREFAGRFGEFWTHPYQKSVPGYPEILLLSEETSGRSREALRAGRLVSTIWHADATFEPAPPRIAVLRGVEIPGQGGDTLWGSMFAAYESLSDRMQQLLEGLHAEHVSHNLARLSKEAQVLEDLREETIVSAHPIVIRHPVNGRKALYVNSNFTRRIVELPELEGQKVLQLLFEHVKAPDFQFRFSWRPGAVAMWDNRSVQHYAVADYTERRVMHRVAIKGPRPA